MDLNENPTNNLSYRALSATARGITDGIVDAKLQQFSILSSSDARDAARRIKMATGWERGANGKWRYKVDDASVVEALAQFNNGVIATIGVHQRDYYQRIEIIEDAKERSETIHEWFRMKNQLEKIDTVFEPSEAIMRISQRTKSPKLVSIFVAKLIHKLENSRDKENIYKHLLDESVDAASHSPRHPLLSMIRLKHSETAGKLPNKTVQKEPA